MKFDKYNMNLDSLICFQLAKTHQLFNKFYKAPLKKFHLTYVQYVVLMALWQKDHSTVHDLGKRVGLNNGTLTPLLKRLEKHGWLVRQRDPKDERKVIVSLTSYGIEQHDAVLDGTQDCFVNLKFSKAQYNKEMKDLQDIQDRIHRAMDKIGVKA